MTKKYILAAISICLSILLSILFVTGMFKVGILESKTIWLLCLFFMILIGIFLYTYFSKNQNVYNIGVFLSFLFNIILLYNVNDLNTRYDYIKDIFSSDSKYVTYNVYVQRKTTIYDQISKLDGHKIGVLYKNFDDVSKNLSQDVNIEVVAYHDIVEIEKAILNGDIQSFALTEEDLADYDKAKVTIMKKVRIIYTNKYKDSV